MATIIVTIKHTIPLMDYGNTALEATNEIEVADGADMQSETRLAHADLRDALGLAILPLVEAEVERCASVLTKEGDNADNWMRRNSKIYQWFRLAYPEVGISAMATLAMPPVLVGLKG